MGQMTASICGGIYSRVYCILYCVYDVVVGKNTESDRQATNPKHYSWRSNTVVLARCKFTFAISSPDEFLVLTANANNVTDFQTLDPKFPMLIYWTTFPYLLESSFLILLVRLTLSLRLSMKILLWADKYSYYQHTGHYLPSLSDVITNISHAYCVCWLGS